MFLKTAWQRVCGFLAWRADADEREPQASGLAGWDVIRIVLGFFLLPAVTLKALCLKVSHHGNNRRFHFSY